MDLGSALAGISGILVMPFDAGGDIAPERQKPIVDRAISTGIHALTANGNAGDYASARVLIADMQVFQDIRAKDQGGANVPGVRAAPALTGKDCGIARPPAAWPLTNDRMARLRDFVTRNGPLRQAAS